MRIESETLIAAPPMRVWRALADFGAYPRWHPYREIVGEAALNARVTMKIGPKPEQRHSIKATITAFEPGHHLAFTTGRWLFGSATETYTLQPSPRGTRICHSTTMTCVGALIGRWGSFGARLEGVYRRVDAALARHVAAGAAQQPSAKKRPQR
jgi:uncharacterized protein YndB with AHSA1/START domain